MFHCDADSFLQVQLASEFLHKTFIELIPAAKVGVIQRAIINHRIGSIPDENEWQRSVESPPCRDFIEKKLFLNYFSTNHSPFSALAAQLSAHLNKDTAFINLATQSETGMATLTQQVFFLLYRPWWTGSFSHTLLKISLFIFSVRGTRTRDLPTTRQVLSNQSTSCASILETNTNC